MILDETNATGKSKPRVPPLILPFCLVPMSPALLVTQWGLAFTFYLWYWSQPSEIRQEERKGGRERKVSEKWRKNETSLGRRQEEESSKGRHNNEGLRQSEAHGSGSTSVPPASGQQLYTAQHVGAESPSQNRELPCRSGGPELVGICKMFFFFFLFH